MNKRIRAKRQAQAIKAARKEALNASKELESCLEDFAEQMQAANLEIAAERGKVKMELAKAQNLADFALEKAKKEIAREAAMDEWIEAAYQEELVQKQRKMDEIAKRQNKISKQQTTLAGIVLLVAVINAIATMLLIWGR